MRAVRRWQRWRPAVPKWQPWRPARQPSRIRRRPWGRVRVKVPPKLQPAHGASLTLATSPSATVDELVTQLAAVTGMNAAEQQLSVGAVPLINRTQTLSAAGIGSGATLELSTAVPHVKVQLPTALVPKFGPTMTVAASPTDTLSTVTARLAAQAGVSAANLSLDYAPPPTTFVRVELPQAVQVAHGPRLTLAIDPEGATLAELKAKVEAQTGVPAVSLSLSLDGVALRDGGEGEADEGLLSGQGVASGGTLVLTLPPGEAVPAQTSSVEVELPPSLRPLYGASLVVAAPAAETVGDLKARVEAVTGLSAAAQVLTSGGTSQPDYSSGPSDYSSGFSDPSSGFIDSGRLLGEVGPPDSFALPSDDAQKLSEVGFTTGNSVVLSVPLTDGGATLASLGVWNGASGMHALSVASPPSLPQPASPTYQFIFNELRVVDGFPSDGMLQFAELRLYIRGEDAPVTAAVVGGSMSREGDVIVGLSTSKSNCTGTVTACSTSAIADLQRVLDAAALDDNQVESETTITAVMSNIPSSLVLSQPLRPPFPPPPALPPPPVLPPPPALPPLPLSPSGNTSIPSTPPPSTPLAPPHAPPSSPSGNTSIPSMPPPSTPPAPSGNTSAPSMPPPSTPPAPSGNASAPSMPPPSTPPATPLPVPAPVSTRRRLSSEAVRTSSSEGEAVSNAARPSLTGGVRRSVRALESDGCQEMVVPAARSANHSRGTNGLPMVVQELERRVQNATDSVKQQAAESEEACGAYAEVETYGVNVEASLRVDTAVAAQMEASTAGTSIALAESTAYGENGTRWVDENAVTNNQTRSVLTLRLPSGAYVERCKLPRWNPASDPQ